MCIYTYDTCMQLRFPHLEASVSPESSFMIDLVRVYVYIYVYVCVYIHVCMHAVENPAFLFGVEFRDGFGV